MKSVCVDMKTTVSSFPCKIQLHEAVIQWIIANSDFSRNFQILYGNTTLYETFGYSIISAKLCKQNTHAAKTYAHNNIFYLNTVGLKVNRAYGAVQPPFLVWDGFINIRCLLRIWLNRLNLNRFIITVVQLIFL